MRGDKGEGRNPSHRKGCIVASIITVNLVSDRAESLLPDLAKALHVEGFDRALPGKAQVLFTTEAKEHSELIRWVQGEISEHGWEDDFVVHHP
jgi:hypothetical protein